MTTWFLSRLSSPDSTEMIAIKNDMFLAAQIGCNCLNIESDCSFTIESIQHLDEYQGPEVATNMECNQLAMKVMYTNCYLEANAVADGLAKNSYSTKSCSFWDILIPDFISHLLVNGYVDHLMNKVLLL